MCTKNIICLLYSLLPKNMHYALDTKSPIPQGIMKIHIFKPGLAIGLEAGFLWVRKILLAISFCIHQLIWPPFPIPLPKPARRDFNKTFLDSRQFPNVSRLKTSPRQSLSHLGSRQFFPRDYQRLTLDCRQNFIHWQE